MDRLDYLKRDSFYTGVTEGNVNTQRIISMMNVHKDELVIDAKGIYSIENFLTARMFMYWQVYFHKTSAVAEHLLIKVLKRAKELAAQGEDLVATENLSYFLKKNKFDKMTEEDLRRFTEMDDSDIMFGLKIGRIIPILYLVIYVNPLLKDISLKILFRKKLLTNRLWIKSSKRLMSSMG